MEAWRTLGISEKRTLLVAAALFVVLAFYTCSRGGEVRTTVYQGAGTSDFKDARVLGQGAELILDSREKLFSKTVRDLQGSQGELKDSYEKLKTRLEELERERASVNGLGSVTGQVGVTAAGLPQPSLPPSPPEDAGGSRSSPNELDVAHFLGARSRSFSGGGGARAGRSAIAFPVKSTPADADAASIVLPAGSYVRAKLMTGVDVPEGRAYPVLLELDFAYVTPNKRRLDLSGCFMIAKSQGDLSTERVQMQATKLSCVSKSGRMFEREVNGFIADDKDNNFAVSGAIHSKQGRVAAQAFLSSIVEGVGKAISSAQTTTQTNALGGSQTSVTGDQGAYMAAGGAANAATLVTQWYLKQAQSLLPTINVVSGRDVWIVMQDTTKLPDEFFRPARPIGGDNESIYSYFSRVSE
ncbi:MAG: TraB/VirB10 family protein [Bdellovibrionales bacterium]|nr:TraB/VirB10 family protein [Bdellovibrionales bacterium]